MATTKKTAPKKAQKAQPEIAEKLADKAMEGSVLTGQPLVVPAEEPETEPPEMPQAPAWQKALEDDYGHVIRNRDQTALLTAILTELVKIRVR